jgi:hypothetical protein
LRTLRVSRVTASAFRCNSAPVLASIAASTRSVFAPLTSPFAKAPRLTRIYA